MIGKNKVKVIYIVGSGHSGSTLINLILGTSENVFALGELKNYQEYAIGVNVTNPNVKNRIMKCDCGLNLNKCVFWKPICEEIKSDLLMPLSPNKRDKIDILFNIFLNKKLHNLEEERKKYNELILNAQKVKSKKVKFIVDSSKNIRNLIFLKENVGIELHILHLVRDGRGVINSYRKLGKSSFNTYFNWLFSNFLISIFFFKFNGNKIKVSYDLFAQNPRKYIQQINKKFNLKISEKRFINDLNKEEYHSIAGNQIIRKIQGNDFVRKEVKSIRYDQSWKRQMPKWQQYVLTVLCYIPNKLWVYNKKYKL